MNITKILSLSVILINSCLFKPIEVSSDVPQGSLLRETCLTY